MTERNAGFCARAMPVLALIALALGVLAMSPPAAASSYGGSGDWVIAVNTTEVVVGETINVSGGVFARGSLELVNSTLTVLNQVNVSGTFTLTNSTLYFTENLTSPFDVPTGFRVGSGGAVVVRDFDGAAAPPADGSVVVATRFGFHSIFYPNSSYTMTNSHAGRIGWAAFPGFSFNQARVTIDGSDFSGGPNALVANSCTAVHIASVAFDHIDIPIALNGGSGHTVDTARIAYHAVGINLVGVTNTALSAINVGESTPLPGYSGWAPSGTALAIDGGSNITLSSLVVTGAGGAGGPQALQALSVRNAANLTVDWVLVTDADLVGWVNSSTGVRFTNLHATRVRAPFWIGSCSNVSIAFADLSGNASGLRLNDVTNLSLLHVTASGLTVEAVNATALKGPVSAQEVHAVDSLGALNLTWTAGGALSILNLTASNVTNGVVLQATELRPLALMGINVTRASGDGLRALLSVLSNFTLDGFTASNIAGYGLSLQPLRASNVSFFDLTLDNTTGGGLRLYGDTADNVTVAMGSGGSSTGPLVQIVSLASARNITVRDLRAEGTAGRMVQLSAGTAEDVRLENLTMEGGNRPYPSFDEAAVILTLGGFRNITLASVTLNQSYRGGVSLLTYGPGDGFAARNLTFAALAGRGLWLRTNTTLSNVSVEDLGYADSGGTALDASNVSTLKVLRVQAPRSGAGFVLYRVRGLTLADVFLSGASMGVWMSESPDAAISNVTMDAWTGFDLSLSSRVAIAGATVNASLLGLRFADGNDLTLSGYVQTGNGTGISVVSAARVDLGAPRLEFGGTGLQLVAVSPLDVDGAVMSSYGAAAARQVLRITLSTGVRIANLTFAGLCTEAGQLDYSHFTVLDGFALDPCEKGLSVSNADNLTLRRAVLKGASNGTALSLSGVADVIVEDADLTSARQYALFVVGATRLRVARVDGSGAGDGGAEFAYSRDIDLVDSAFNAGNGTGLEVIGGAGATAFTNVSVAGNAAGLQILSSAGVAVTQLDASSNRGIGVFIDPYSPRALLRNLTLSGNAQNGLLASLNGTTLIDGNVSRNGADGIASSPGVRLNWTVEVAGSFADDRMRLTGDLSVSAGASFAARNATIRIDGDARRFDASPFTLIDIWGSAAFEGATVEALNLSKPYTAAFEVGSDVRISGSTWTGGARTDALSIISSAGALSIDNSTFTGWNRPLSQTGSRLDIRDSRFTENAQGPWVGAGSAALSNVTSDLEAGDGFTLIRATPVAIAGGRFESNSGVGLRATDIVDLSITGLTLISNAQGGGVIVGSNMTATRLSVLANTVMGLALTGGRTLVLSDLVCRSNSGVSLSVAGAIAVNIANASITYGGGTGVSLSGLAAAWFAGGEVSRNGAMGLRATDVANLTVVDALFNRNALPHIVLEGSTGAWIAESTFVESAGDAIALSGRSTASIVNAHGDDRTGRVFATDFSYAYVLNSTFPAPGAELFGKVDVAWDVRVLVLRDSGSPAAGANVEVRTKAGALAAQASTAPDGSAPPIAVLEKTVFGNGTVTRFGPHAVSARLAGAGSAATSLTIDRFTVVELRLDAGPPVVELTLDGPQGAGGWFVGPLTAFLEARDNAPYGVTLYWRVGSAVAWESAVTATNVSSAFLSFPDQGETLLEYYAVDGSGNAAAVESVLVRIDLAKPAANFVDLPSLVRGANFTVGWNGTDEGGSGIADFSVEVSFEGGPFAAWKNTTALTSANFTGEDGRYTFRLVARDRAGLLSQPAVASVQVKIFGTMRLAVVDSSGLPIPGAEAFILGTNLSLRGAGGLTFRLPEGHYAVRVSAPGYNGATREFDVVAGNSTDLGSVELAPVTVSTASPDLSLLYLGAVVAAAAGAAAIVVGMRASRRRQE